MELGWLFYLITHINKARLKSIETGQIILNLAKALGLPELRPGKIVIRDERDWRVNEKEIDYCWLVNISKSFVGWCWLFTIKFEKSEFRDVHNQEELIQGIFTLNKAGDIENLYLETLKNDLDDEIRNLSSFDLFDTNKGRTLDGVNYEYIVISRNANIHISLNNPNVGNWKIWEHKIEILGKSLSQKSGITVLKEIFV